MHSLTIKFSLASLVVVVIAPAVRGQITAPATVSVDFNLASDVNDFALAAVGGESVTFTHDPNGGVGSPASGAGLFSNFSTNNGANDASVIYAPGGDPNSGRITFNPGESILTSVTFQVDDAAVAATPRLGIAADDGFFSLTDRNVIGGGGTDHTGITVLTTTTADKFLQVRNAAGAAGTTNAVSATELPFNTGEWFTFNLSILKSTVPDQFIASGSVDRLNADGTAVDTADYLTVPGTSFTNAALYTATEVFIGFHADASGTPLTHAGEFDDFTFEVTEAAIPGDVDGDGDVDFIETDNDMISDFDIISSNFLNSVSSRSEGDLVPDGVVNLFDFREWKTAFEALPLTAAVESVPEPTSAMLALSASAFVLFGRRIRH